MVLAVVIGDLHFKKTEPDRADLVINKITEQIKKIEPDIVVFLGDILDTHEKIDMKTQNKAIRMIKHIAGPKTEVFLVIGNHERPDGTCFLTEDSSFYCLKGVPYIHVADRVLDVKFGVGNNGENIRFVFVPYVPTGKFHDALDTLEEKVMSKNRPVCIFAHQEFKGIQLGNGKSKHGDDWPETNPLVISGHIHTFQMLNNNILYPGTPYQQSWSDDSKKGIIVAEFLPGKSPTINFLELEIRRKKIIRLKPSEVDTFVPPPNCYVQVDIVGSSAEIKALSETGIISTMRSKGISVSLSSENTANPSNPQNKALKELLLDMINTDPDATNLFHEIFAPRSSATTTLSAIPINLTDLLKTVNAVSPQPAPQTSKAFDLSSLLASQQVTERAPVAPAIMPTPVPATPATLPGVNLMTSLTSNSSPPPQAPSTPATMRVFGVSGGASMSETPLAPEQKISKPDLISSLVSSAQAEKNGPKPGTLDFILASIKGPN